MALNLFGFTIKPLPKSGNFSRRYYVCYFIALLVATVVEPTDCVACCVLNILYSTLEWQCVNKGGYKQQREQHGRDMRGIKTVMHSATFWETIMSNNATLLLEKINKSCCLETEKMSAVSYQLCVQYQVCITSVCVRFDIIMIHVCSILRPSRWAKLSMEIFCGSTWNSLKVCIAALTNKERSMLSCRIYAKLIP